MCGLMGVFNNKNVIQLVSKGLKIIEYRGRDGFEVYNNKDFAIGHCLHAVVNKVKQPFVNKGVFVVNCELYNWKELCTEFDIKAKNDAELFFLLVEKFGVEETLELVDGDYAGAYVRNERLYLFRDRIGVKPIWYSWDNGFGFASEKKALIDFKNIVELNPRELLIYDIKSKEVKINNLDFYKISKTDLSYDLIKKELGGYFVDAIAKRIPEVKLGLLFSGGVDSSFIALVLKKLDIEFTCYTCAVKDLGKEAEDLGYARKAAKILGLDLKVVEVDIETVEKELPFVCKLIESNNVTKVGVALPFYFACKQAAKDKVKVVFSGLGSEELFAGYERHLKSTDINKECVNGLLNIYERDLYRDDTVTMVNSLELRVPFLDSKLIEFALSIDEKYKINDKGNKVVLRETALDYGLNKEFAFRKKRAAQYGSGFLKCIEKLSKRNKCKTKSEYLSGFYNEGNVKLGVLFSSGKDSCYAMQVMKKQNYDIKCLITIKSKNKDSYMYHTPNVDLVGLQAEALEIPLIMQETIGEKEKELEDLEIALTRAKKEFEIEGVVVGALYSTYQRDRVQAVCDKLGLKVFVPLWHKDQEVLLKELLDNGFKFIISSIASDGFDKSWLGKQIGKKEVEEIIKLSKKYRLNPCGEGGEYESLVIDCQMFKKKIEIVESEKIMDSSCSGSFKIKKAKLVEKLK